MEPMVAIAIAAHLVLLASLFSVGLYRLGMVEAKIDKLISKEEVLQMKLNAEKEHALIWDAIFERAYAQPRRK